MSKKFQKYSSLGNDFIIFEDVSLTPKIIRTLCDRYQGIGADGIITYKSLPNADICMRIYNSDGSEASFCGSGTGCLSQHLFDEKKYTNTISIKTNSGVVKVKKLGQKVQINMFSPKNISLNQSLVIHGVSKAYHSIDTGVNHAILFVDDLESISVKKEGKEFRYHKDFSPFGINVNFAQIKNNKVHVRVYEKGVENETLSCGSGAVAVSIISSLILKIKPPITIHFSRGDLEVNFLRKEKDIASITLTGSFQKVFSGTVDINFSEMLVKTLAI